MIRKFKMKKLTCQPHKCKTRSRHFVKTIWRVGSIIEKLSKKNCDMDMRILCVNNKEKGIH